MTECISHRSSVGEREREREKDRGKRRIEELNEHTLITIVLSLAWGGTTLLTGGGVVASSWLSTAASLKRLSGFLDEIHCC